MADTYDVVQQVSGVVAGYNALRDRVAALEAELFTRNQDIARLQKALKQVNDQEDSYKSTISALDKRVLEQVEQIRLLESRLPSNS